MRRERVLFVLMCAFAEASVILLTIGKAIL